MGRHNHRSLLSQQIADIVAGRSGRSLICAGAAVAALVPVQAGAVALGDITIQSALGQPFQATVPVRTAPGEMLTPDCISATGGNGGDLKGLQQPGVRTPETSQAGVHTLTVTTRQPVYEPMYELRLKVHCPGAPILVRHYVLMLDLPGLYTLQPQIVTPGTPALPEAPALKGTLRTPAAATRPSRPPSRSAVSRALPADNRPIPAGSSYRVTSGDTLSTIARRVEGRPPNSIWWLADRIAAANPHAFIRNNPDLIKLGTVIRIPAASIWQAGAGETKPALASASTLPVAPAREQVTPAARPVATEVTESIARPARQQTSALPDSPRAPAFMPEMPEMPATSANTDVVSTDSGAVTDSPFLDDQVALPAPAVDAVPVSNDVPAVAQPDSPPAIVSDAAATGNRTANPLIAAAVGILLGLILSGLLLRDRLLAKLGLSFNRQPRKSRSTVAKRPDPVIDTSDTLTDLFAATEDDNATTAEIAQPAIAPEPLAESFGEPESVGEPLFAAGSEQATMVGTINPVDSELAYLFDEDPDVDDSHATATMQTPVVDIGEEFRDMATAQTEELPGNGDTTRSTAPTQELPRQADDEENPDIDLDDTSDIDLNSLASSAVYDDKLSATLQEALTLLEQDYEEELTASQILTVDAAEEALRDGSLGEGEPGDFEHLPKREGTG